MPKSSIALVFAILAGLPVPALAVEGDYIVAGTNLDGSSYAGTAVIARTSDTTCAIEWTTGASACKGICMLEGDVLVASYVMSGVIGLVVYHLLNDGTLYGRWTTSGQDGSGIDILTPATPANATK